MVTFTEQLVITTEPTNRSFKRQHPILGTSVPRVGNTSSVWIRRHFMHNTVKIKVDYNGRDL